MHYYHHHPHCAAEEIETEMDEVESAGPPPVGPESCQVRATLRSEQSGGADGRAIDPVVQACKWHLAH